MEAKSFAYWLQGYLEISGAKELSEQELTIIKDHLKLVFDKQTPTYLYQSGGTSGLPITQGPYMGGSLPVGVAIC